MTLTAIEPARFPWLRTEGYTFSLGLRDGDTAWLSGHSGSAFDVETGRVRVRGGMIEQAETAYAKITAILAAAGMSLADVTRLTENVTVEGLDDLGELAAARRVALGDHAPAVVTLPVDRLLRRRALIEIEVEASLGGGTALPGGLREDAEGTVYLPSILPVDEGGNVVAEGDFRGQYRHCLERAAALLEPVGLGLDHVVRTVDFSTPDTREVYPRSGRPRRELLGPVYPAAAGILMSRMPVDGALVTLEVVASRHAPEVVNPGWARYETLTYNPAIKAGRRLFAAGFAALDPETQQARHDGDVVAQARYTYEAILQVLEAAGAGPEHLVSTVEYVCPAGLAAYRKVADVRRELLREPWPTSTGIVCGGLLRPEFLLEVIPTALLPA
jgi:enamine deaminase RidA (YjgF/YER057c/UK114 family)